MGSRSAVPRRLLHLLQQHPDNPPVPSSAMPLQPSRDLIALPNPHPAREYEVRCDTPEFTCMCPVTGQPDFASVRISYVPGPSIVELKSLKQYLWTYRDEGAFHEDVTNRILEDLVAAVNPRRMTVVTDWLVRGGIHTEVEASHP
jgi:7-cyano-7-deazaguanine reductase